MTLASDTHSNVPYVLVTGSTIADDWADLIDGTLANAIIDKEFGVWNATDTYYNKGQRRDRRGHQRADP